MLIVNNLKKNYGDIKAVNGISFEINSGEIVGLLGPNGAGKSTTISMIATLLAPSGGQILFENQDILKNPKAIQPFLGYIPQDIALYDTLSGYENLKYFGGLYGLKGKKLEEQIGRVSEIIGIKDRLKDKVKSYSGGMKRRINIGAGLLHEPKLIIMDEPTVGIDPQSRNHILETVRDLRKTGASVLYTTHYMEEVEAVCEKIYIMDKGKIIAGGTKESLIEKSGIESTIKLKFEKDLSFEISHINNIESIKKISAVSEKEIVVIPKGNGESHKDILREIMNLDLGLQSFDIVSPNLEMVFLQITGRELRD